MDEGGRRNEEKSGRGGLPSAAPRLLEAFRDRLLYMHYSLRTEAAYVHWVRGFVRWARGQRHPRERGAAEIQAFLSMLANERRVAAITHDRAAPGIETREPLPPCCRATPSSTARATSAS